MQCDEDNDENVRDENHTSAMPPQHTKGFMLCCSTSTHTMIPGCRDSDPGFSTGTVFS